MSRLIFVLLIFYLPKAQNFQEIKLIKSYAEKQQTPTPIMIFVCWNKVKIHRAYQELVELQDVNVITNFSKIFQIEFVQNTLLVADSKCEDFHFLLAQAEVLRLFKMSYKWLVFNISNDSVPFAAPVLIDSNFAVVTKIPNGLLHLKLLYKYTPSDHNFVYNDLGIFADNFLYYREFINAKNRSNLRGTNITVPYVMINTDYPFDVIDYRYSHIDSVGKLSYLLVYHMLEMLNCTKHFIQYDTWGYKPQNSTYYDGGMLRDIQNGAAEIAGTVLLYTESRLDVVEYVGATTPTDIKFILKAPPLSSVHNIFTLPFDLNVWYSIYAITIIILFILYTAVVWENRYEFRKENPIENIKPKFSDVTMVQIGVITQQGSETEPRSNAGRIVLLITLLVLMFLYNAYSANIVVLLQSSSRSIKTVQDLLHSEIELGAEDIVYNRYFFANQKEPTRKAIYEKKIAPKNQKPHFRTVQDGISKVRNEFFAFNVDTNSGYKVIMDTFQEHEKCGLVEIDYLNFLWPSLSVRRNSSYKEIVKVGYRKLYDTGIRQRHVRRLFVQKPQCESTGGSFISVGIVETFFSFKLFCIGLGVAVCLLIMEIIFWKYSILEKIKYLSTYLRSHNLH